MYVAISGLQPRRHSKEMSSRWKSWEPPVPPEPPARPSHDQAAMPATTTAHSDEFLQKNWQPDVNFYDCQRIQGQPLPRTISNTWKMSQAPMLNLCGKDPLEVRLADCLLKGADEWPFRVFANGGCVGINIARNLSDRSWNIESVTLYTQFR